MQGRGGLHRLLAAVPVLGARSEAPMQESPQSPHSSPTNRTDPTMSTLDPSDASAGNGKGITRQIPPFEWTGFLDAFTRIHLGTSAERATIEVHSLSGGDQIYAQGARLLSVSYDPRGDILDVELQDVDHLIFRPRELWIQEGGVGDRIATLRIVDDDGAQELIHVHQGPALAERNGDPA